MDGARPGSAGCRAKDPRKNQSASAAFLQDDFLSSPVELYTTICVDAWSGQPQVQGGWPGLCFYKNTKRSTP